MTDGLNAGRIPWRLVGIFSVLVLGISIAGRVYYVNQKEQIKREKQAQLAAIANLKVAQISQWRDERIADGRAVVENPFLTECVKTIGPNRRVRGKDVELMHWLNSFGSSSGYEMVELLDRTGKSVLPEASKFQIETQEEPLIDEAAKTGKIVFSDLYRDSAEDHIYCDVIAPVSSGGTTKSVIPAVVLLRINASKSLYPLLQSWPEPSKTSEVLLVEREGEQILYLNELRYTRNVPLMFRKPIADRELLGSKAIVGSEGVAEGIDYRGAPVLGSLNEIPNSPWHLIAKVDQQEVYAPIQERSQTVSLFVILVIIAAGSSIALLWRHQRSVYYRRTLELELKRKVIEEHFDALMKHANDAIVILDMDGRVLDVNEKASSMYGRSRDEFIGCHVEEAVAPEARVEFEGRMAEVQQSNGMVFESKHQKKDGTVFPVEVSARVIATEGKRFFQNIIRDTSERKQAIEALRLSEEKFSKAFLTSPDAIGLNKLKDGTFIEINDGFSNLTGFGKNEVVGKSSLEIDIWAVPEDRTRFVRELVRHGEVNDFEAEFITKSGTKRTGLVSGRLIDVQREQWILTITRDITERKKAEKTLVENEERMRVALEGANIAVFNQDTDLRYTWVYNPQREHSMSAVVGKSDRELLSPQDVKEIVGIKEKVLSSGKGAHAEISLERNGDRSYFDLTVEPLRNEKGRIVGITGASLDITNRKKAEEQFLLQKAYFQQLFESAPEAIVLLTADEHIIQVNQEFTRLFGYSQEDTVGRELNDLIVPHTHKQEGLTLSRRVAQGSIISTESIRQRKDGTLVDVSILGRPVRVEGGQIALYAIYREITDRKRAEEALRKSESSFRGLFNSVSDAIYIQDREGRFVDVNQGAVNMYGFPREYLVGKNPSDISAPGKNDLAKIEGLVQRAFDGVPQQFEFWGVRKNGEEFPKEVRVSKGTYFGQEVVIALAQDITGRKRFETVLQETNRTLESLIKASPLAITVMDQECEIQLWNPAAERMFGWKADEVIGNFNPIVPEEDRHEFIASHTNVVNGKTIREFEVRRRKKDGTPIDINRSTAVIHDVDGNIKGIMAVLADITERKRAEEKLRESEERLRLALTGANMMSWELDATSGKVTWSEMSERFYGLRPNEFKGTREAYVQLIHPDDRVAAEQMMDESFKHGTEYKSEFRVIWPDGSVHWLAAFGKATRDERGRPVRMSGIGVDVTERKRTEEAIQRLHQAVEQTDEVIIMTEPDGVITYVNPAFEKLYRYSREEVIGKTPRVLKSGGMTQEYYTLFWRDLVAGKSIRAEHINKTKDGKIVIVEASVNSVYDARGKLTGFIAVQEDISDRKRNESERKRLEAQLLQTQKLESIGTLAGGIAHDFNNILGIILAYSSSLRNARLPFEKVVSAADVINQAVGRGAELVKQILTFARKTDVVYGLVNINTMIRELKRMLAETLPRTITIATELGNDVPDVTADATQVHQAILNICVNARDAMPAGGKLTLRTHIGTRSEVSSYFPEATSERYIRVSISDTGTGMDESTRQRIFEPFFTTKPKGKGTGLGLSVVYGVVKNHNGFVRVDSEIGRGTTFHLYFPAPIHAVQPSEKTQGSLVDIPGGSECILVVEDEEPLLNVLSGLLKSKGYRVFMAHDGYEAVETYEQHHKEISVVVSDLGLPKMTGQDAFLRMKSVNPRVKVIFGTGYLDPELKTELLNLGAKGFLAKPYSQDDLLRRIRELIDIGG